MSETNANNEQLKLPVTPDAELAVSRDGVLPRVTPAAGDLIPISPQPRRGAPFRIAFVNRGPEYWYNEAIGYPERQMKYMLHSWRCPFGANGKPVKVGETWYWKKVQTSTVSE